MTLRVGLGVGFEVGLAVGISLLRQAEERMLRGYEHVVGRASVGHRASPFGLVLLAVVGYLVWRQHNLVVQLRLQKYEFFLNYCIFGR